MSVKSYIVYYLGKNKDPSDNCVVWGCESNLDMAPRGRPGVDGKRGQQLCLGRDHAHLRSSCCPYTTTRGTRTAGKMN